MQLRSSVLVALATPFFVTMANAQQLGAVTGSFPTPASVPIPVGLDWNFPNADLKLTGIGTVDSVDTIDLAGVSSATFAPSMSSNPIGITTDGTNLYVTDTTGDDVDVYDLLGNYISSFSVVNETTFPEGIAYNITNQNLYVVDGAGGNEVEIYDLTGVHQGSFPILGSSPDGIAYDIANNAYWIYDSGTDFIRLYDDVGTVLASFRGTSFHGFGTSEGVALIGTDLYLVATGQDTIVKFNADLLSPQPAALTAVGETVLNSGTLTGASQQSFVGGDFLRWKMDAVIPSQMGNLCAVIINLGDGSLPTGVTAAIPGFNQLWAGSTPSGFQVTLPPHLIGQEHNFLTPPNFFALGSGLRIQGLSFEPSITPLPVLPTNETISLLRTVPCVAGVENFDLVSTTVGSYPVNWANGGGTAEWRADASGTTSANTGPSAAISLPNYMYCETSGGGGTATFIMNTDTYSSAGVTGVAFQLSRIGATIGTLTVRMGDGTGTFPTVLGTFTGAVAGEWNLTTLPLGAAPPANVQFQFDYIAGGSFTGDLAIEDFCLYQ